MGSGLDLPGRSSGRGDVRYASVALAVRGQSMLGRSGSRRASRPDGLGSTSGRRN
jgi:hypothetical protein